MVLLYVQALIMIMHPMQEQCRVEPLWMLYNYVSPAYGQHAVDLILDHAWVMASMQLTSRSCMGIWNMLHVQEIINMAYRRGSRTLITKYAEIDGMSGVNVV